MRYFQDVLDKNLNFLKNFEFFSRCFGRKFLRKFWSLRKIWSLSDRWAVWECIRVNISARVRTRKLKIGRRTELESYFQDLDIRHRYARGNIICSKDMQIWFYTKNSKFSESSWTLNSDFFEFRSKAYNLRNLWKLIFCVGWNCKNYHFLALIRRVKMPRVKSFETATFVCMVV